MYVCLSPCVCMCACVCVKGSHVEFSSSARRRRDVCEQKTRNKSTSTNVDIANDGVARLLTVCVCMSACVCVCIWGGRQPVSVVQRLTRCFNAATQDILQELSRPRTASLAQISTRPKLEYDSRTSVVALNPKRVRH